ncbi:MAG: SEC-C metal-binding domain-containing protein, partial [Myxococcaceae bacterium]
MNKVGRNELCPCGSGKKFKKCCQAARVSVGYSQDDRVTAFSKLELFIENRLGREDDLAMDEFWGRYQDHPDQLEDWATKASEDACDLWFSFDRPLESGELVVDLFLREHAGLFAGERRFLEALRESSMRLYEVLDTRPGLSVTLRDSLEGATVTVNERAGSRSLRRADFLAARIVP